MFNANVIGFDVGKKGFANCPREAVLGYASPYPRMGICENMKVNKSYQSSSW